MLFDHVREADADGDSVSVSRGVAISRRALLRYWVLGSAALAGGLSSRLLVGRADGDEASDSAARLISLDDALREVLPAARAMAARVSSEEESYLALVEKVFARVDVRALGPLSAAAEAGVEMQRVAIALPVVVYEIVMEPGTTIPLHDHRNYNGALMAVDGDAVVDRFDFACGEVELESGDAFYLRAKGRQVLRPGDTTSLTSRRHNVHEVRAGARGARLLDVFTILGPRARSVRLGIADPSPVIGGVYRAAWIDS